MGIRLTGKSKRHAILLAGAFLALFQTGCMGLEVPALPDVPATATDKTLAKTFNDNKPVFIELKEMLAKDPKLNNVGEGYVNNSKTDAQPIEDALKNTDVSKERFEKYQALMQKVGCKSVGYDVQATDPSKANKDHVLYLMWAISNGPQTHMKMIVNTAGAKPPQGYPVVTDTTEGKPSSDLSIGCVSEITPGWYVQRWKSGTTKWP
jgi:hypothetical protein